MCGLTPEQFYKLTPKEYNILIIGGLKRKEERMKENLELAAYISSLVLNEKMQETYKSIYKSINFTEKFEGNLEVKKEEDLEHWKKLVEKRGLNKKFWDR